VDQVTVFLQDLAEKRADSSVVVGDGMAEGVQLGPINNRPQFERVAQLVADAIARGATAVAGGRARDGAGYFYEPTILTDLSDGTRIVDEEQFGPALPVITYRDVDDVIDRANATNFGLSGSSVETSPRVSQLLLNGMYIGWIRYRSTG